MTPYTLDYSRPGRIRHPDRQGRRPRRRMYRTFRRLLPLFSGLLCSIGLVGLLWQHEQTRLLRERTDAQTVQYDSLLAAKVEGDRQLAQLRVRLLK